MLNEQNALRVAIRYTTTDVPGPSSDRAQRVANDFTLKSFQRTFDWDRDFVHCPTDFDTEAIKSVWILCDFNVSERIFCAEEITVQCWHVRYGTQMTP